MSQQIEAAKMADILQTTFSNAFCWMKIIFNTCIKISLNIVSKSLIDNKSTLVQVMTCCQQAIELKIVNTRWHHMATMC